MDNYNKIYSKVFKKFNEASGLVVKNLRLLYDILNKNANSDFVCEYMDDYLFISYLDEDDFENEFAIINCGYFGEDNNLCFEVESNNEDDFETELFRINKNKPQASCYSILTFLRDEIIKKLDNAE